MMLLQRLLGISILAGSLGVGWLWTDYREFLQTPLRTPAEGLVYTLTAGASASSLGRELAQQGILSSSLYMRLFARQDDNALRLKVGEYRIPPGTTPQGLLSLLASGKVIQYPITLVEGWNFRQVREALEADSRIENTLVGLDDKAVMARMGRPDDQPEGLFLPDTYHFPKGLDDLRILRRAMQSMAEVLAAEWKQRDAGLPLETLYQALILASIVEKETGLAGERPHIAGVFLRRLRKGMLLQTDPTVIYGMGDAFDGNIRRTDLKRDTPYNTYTRAGLPPTPIAMPGRAAIHAVLHPADGTSLYFVARGDGGHVFSSTLKEHNKAVRKYQLKRKRG